MSVASFARKRMEPFGLARPDSVRSLVNRADAAMVRSHKVRNEFQQLRKPAKQT